MAKNKKEKKIWFRNVYPFKMLYNGEWADPEIKGYGIIVNYWDFEDALWNICNEDYKEKNINIDDRPLDERENVFQTWIESNKEIVREVFKDQFLYNPSYSA